MKIPRFVYKENRWGTFQPKVVQARDGEVVWYSTEEVNDEEEEEEKNNQVPRVTKSSSLRRFDSNLGPPSKKKHNLQRQHSSIKVSEYQAVIIANTRRQCADVVFTLKQIPNLKSSTSSDSVLPSPRLLLRKSSSSQRKRLKLRYDTIEDAMDFVQYDLSQCYSASKVISPSRNRSRKRIERMRNERRETQRIFAYVAYECNHSLSLSCMHTRISSQVRNDET